MKMRKHTSMENLADFKTSSSTKWAERSANAIFHLFIQLPWEKLFFFPW